MKKVSIIISKGALDEAYPGLILANGARMEGIEANLFFTFYGLNVILKNKSSNLKVASVGNPALPFPSLLGALPGVSSLLTKIMKKRMEKLDFPSIPEFLDILDGAGCRLYACKASVDMFNHNLEDFIPIVKNIISVGEFYELSGDAQIIFI